MIDTTLLRAPEVAELMGLETKTIYSLAARGKLPVIRVTDRAIRFRRESIERWLQDREEFPAADE